MHPHSAAHPRFAAASVSALAPTPCFSRVAALVDHAHVLFAPAPLAPPPARASAALPPPPPASRAPALQAPSLTAIAYPAPTVLYTADARGALTRYAVPAFSAASPPPPPPSEEQQATTANAPTPTQTPEPAPAAVTKVFAIPAAHSGIELTAVAARAPDAHFVSAAKDGSIRAWDPATGAAVARLSGHRYDVRALALAASSTGPASSSSSSASGSGDPVTIVASAGRDRTVRLWDVRAAASGPVHVFRGHAGWVHDVALAEGTSTSSPSSPVAVSASGDKTVRVWDLRTMTQRAVLAGHEYRVWSVDVAHDASLAVSASTDATVRVWHLDRNLDEQQQQRQQHDDGSANGEGEAARRNPRFVAFEPHSDSALAVALHPSAEYVLSASEDGSVVATGCAHLFDDDHSPAGRSAEDPDFLPTATATAAADPPSASAASAAESLIDAPLISLEDANGTSPSASHPPRALDTQPLQPETPTTTAATTTTSSSSAVAAAAAAAPSPTPARKAAAAAASPPTTPELRAASTAPPHSLPGFDKSAAELVGALRRVRELEASLQAVEQRAVAAETLAAEARAKLAQRDAEVAILRRESADLRGLAQNAQVRALLRDNPRKADVSLDYQEPANKIGAVSDQLSALAARLDAMIATK